LLRLLPWITRQPFTQAYWAFSFGMTALAGGALEMSQRGVSGAIPTLAAPVFILTNLTLLTLAVDTVWRLLQGRLLPPPMMAPSESS
jgi:tellurite resistance protein